VFQLVIVQAFRPAVVVQALHKTEFPMKTQRAGREPGPPSLVVIAPSFGAAGCVLDRSVPVFFSNL